MGCRWALTDRPLIFYCAQMEMTVGRVNEGTASQERRQTPTLDLFIFSLSVGFREERNVWLWLKYWVTSFQMREALQCLQSKLTLRIYSADLLSVTGFLSHL